jgi:hypothetical protein
MGPLGTSATEWPIVPAPGDYDYGVFGGMKIVKGNRSPRRKPFPAPLCPPQIPLHQTRARTRAAAVGSQRLTAWAMAQPMIYRLFELTWTNYPFQKSITEQWREIIVSKKSFQLIAADHYTIVYVTTLHFKYYRIIVTKDIYCNIWSARCQVTAL